MSRTIIFENDLKTIIHRTEIDDRVRWYEPSDRATLIAHDVRERTLDWFLERGCRIAVLESDGQAVAWNFYSFGDMPHFDWMLIHVPGDAVYASNSYVRPGHRGNQTVARLKGFACRYFVGEGYKRLLSSVSRDNIASLKAHEFVGARAIDEIYVARLGGLRGVWRGGRLRLGYWTNARPYELFYDEKPG